MKDLLQPFDADALAEVGALGVMRHGGVQAQVEKPAKDHIGLGAFHDLAIGQLVMKAQEQDLEHADGIDRRAAHRGTVGVVKAWSKALEIHQCLDASQVMIGRHHGGKDPLVKIRQRHRVLRVQHDRDPRTNRSLIMEFVHRRSSP